MKAILLALLVAAASAQTLSSFRTWARAHNKVYSVHEEARRFAIYKENLAVAERLNLEYHGTASFGATKFSDLTNEEFKAMYTTEIKGRETRTMELPTSSSVNEDNVDLRYMLPAIKNQASCGSCWAFSAVANMEGQTYMNNGGKVVSLSEQQLVSCDKGFNMGCNGGNPSMADIYAIEKGMASEKDYPYTSGDGSVAKCQEFEPVAFFTNLRQMNMAKDEQLIEDLGTYGPISVAIEADKAIFQQYTGGILDGACGKLLNHAVILAGYGTEDGIPYWLVRNSWGDDWGEAGYVRLVRDKDMCGINMQGSTIIA